MDSETALGSLATSSGLHSHANQPINESTAVDSELLSRMTGTAAPMRRDISSSANGQIAANDVIHNQSSASVNKVKTVAKGRVFDIFADLVPIRCQLEVSSKKTLAKHRDIFRLVKRIRRRLISNPLPTD